MKEILNTFDPFKNYTMEVFQEYKEEEERETGIQFTKTYEQFVYDSIEQEQDDFFTNLKYSKVNNYPCIITGSLGLWDGKHEIYPVFKENLSEAIIAAAEEGDDYIVSYNEEYIQVISLHHDGRNIFEIRLLSDKGEEEKENYLDFGEDFQVTDKTNFVTIPEYLF